MRERERERERGQGNKEAKRPRGQEAKRQRGNRGNRGNRGEERKKKRASLSPKETPWWREAEREKERRIEKERKKWTNLQNKGLISADRGTKATLMLTIPCSIFKSSTKDLSFPIFELVIQHRLTPPASIGAR